MKIKGIIAIVAAGILAISVPMVALADVPPTPITENTNYDGDINTSIGSVINVNGAKTINISGNVGTTDSSASAIIAQGGADVTVGSVTANGTGVTTSGDTGGTTITVGGAVNVSSDTNQVLYGIKSNGNNSIVESGDVIITQSATTGSKKSYAVYANTSTTVQVGSISGSQSNSGAVTGIFVDSSNSSIQIAAKSIDVDGSNSVGIHTNNAVGSVILCVEGNISADSCGIYMQRQEKTTDYDTTVLCSGTITGQNAIEMNRPFDTAKIDLVIYQLEATSGDLLKIYNDDDEKSKTEDILKNINYVVLTGQNSSALTFSGTESRNYTFGVGTSLEKNLSFNTQVEGKEINVKVADGYELNAGKGIIVSKDSNGNYVVRIPRGGGVTLEAVLKAIAQTYHSGGGAWPSVPTTTGSIDAPISNGAWKVENGVYTYTVNGESLKNTIACIKYTDANGKEAVGFFYFDKTGKMQTEWQKIGDKYYYFEKTTGAMLMNTKTPDGYTLGADGAWVA